MFHRRLKVKERHKDVHLGQHAYILKVPIDLIEIHQYLILELIIFIHPQIDEQCLEMITFKDMSIEILNRVLHFITMGKDGCFIIQQFCNSYHLFIQEQSKSNNIFFKH